MSVALRLCLGADHGGFDLKKELVEGLLELKYSITDLGVPSADPSDYADVAHLAAQSISSGKFDGAILVDGTGIGMAIVANRYPGVRAANCSDVFSARYSREHNDANVLTLGGRVLGVGLAWEVVNVWLQSTFKGGERHQRRVSKIERS